MSLWLRCRRLQRSGRSIHELRPVLEVHGVVVGPFPAPDKAVPLEYLDDFGRHSVGGSAAGPEPVFSMARIDVDCRAPGVHARRPRIGHSAAVVCPCGWIGIALYG